MSRLPLDAMVPLRLFNPVERMSAAPTARMLPVVLITLAAPALIERSAPEAIVPWSLTRPLP